MRRHPINLKENAIKKNGNAIKKNVGQRHNCWPNTLGIRNISVTKTK